MSAYVVDRNLIRYLVEAGVYVAQRSRSRIPYDQERAFTLGPGTTKEEKRAIAQDLWDENINSVAHRYPDDSTDNLPGPADEDFTFTKDDFPPVWNHNWKIGEILSAADCYEYQSCEHPGWEDSNACAYIDKLRSRAYSLLKDYENAPWGAPELP